MEHEPNNTGWKFNREVSIPHVVTLILLLFSMISAYFAHDTRLTMLEARQQYALKHIENLEKEVVRIARMEEKLDSMNANICDLKEAINQMRKQQFKP